MTCFPDFILGGGIDSLSESVPKISTASATLSFLSSSSNHSFSLKSSPSASLSSKLALLAFQRSCFSSSSFFVPFSYLISSI